MNNNLSITTLVLLLSCLAAHAQLPDMIKVFDRNKTLMVSKSDNRGKPIYSFVTDEEFDAIKAAFLKAMGEGWEEIERFDAGHKTGLTGKDRKDKNFLLGDLRLANPKFPKDHVILALFNTPNKEYGTKYSMMILVDPAPPKVEEPPKKD